MKTSGVWDFRSTSRLLMGLALAAMIGSTAPTPALGKQDNRNRVEKHDNRNDQNGRHRDDRGRYDKKGHRDDRGRYDKRGHRHYRERYECYRVVRGKRVYEPCGKRRTYTPPRVIYAPPPPDGIRIFLPPIPFPFPHR